MCKEDFISVLIVTRNEEDYIENVLNSIINQSISKERYEILVIDGMSNDKTMEYVEKYVEKYSNSDLKISTYKNPKLSLSAGWNIGIRASKGEYIVRVDAHGEISKNFLEKSLETIKKIGSACVGGPLVTRTIDNSDDNIVSKVLSSPFGVGNSKFRVSEEAGYADSVGYGFYKKDTYEKVGFYNEKFIRNQDLEFKSRLKRAGEKIYFNPEIKAVYYARNTVKKMLKQAYANGKWNLILLKNDFSALSIRHLVPLAFVMFILLTSMGGYFSNYLWILEGIILFVYFTIGIIFALKKSKNIVETLQITYLFFLLHCFYGCGSLVGIFKRL